MEIRFRTHVSQSGSCACDDETHHAAYQHPTKGRPPKQTLTLYPEGGTGAVEFEFPIDAKLPKAGSVLEVEV